MARDPRGLVAAWTRFASIEAAGAIVPVRRRTPPVGPIAARVNENPGPFGQNTAPLGETAEPTGETLAAAGGSTARYGQFAGPFGQKHCPERFRPAPGSGGRGRTGAIAAAALLAVASSWGWPGFSRRTSAGPASPSRPAS